MHPSRTRSARSAVLGLVVATIAAAPLSPVLANGPSRPGILVPIGSDYQPDTLELFARQAAQRDTSGHVVLLVLPITYSLDAYTTSDGERQENLDLAGERAQQVEDACNAVKAPAQTCDAPLVPVLIRDDALLQSNVDFFTPDVDGMYVLGGDQTVAMQAVAGTPVEAAMTAAFQRGAVFGGNSAGDAVQSRDMINGYAADFEWTQQLQRGAVDVWTDDGAGDLTRGLPFGMKGIISDQHVFEYGRMGRSINVALGYGEPVLGMDAATGGVLTGNRILSDVTGDTTGFVIDPLTYRAGARWTGPTDTLSARRVAIHLVAPGAFGFDFARMQPIWNGKAVAAPRLGDRSYPAARTPRGAGPLLLSGGIVVNPAGPVGTRFVKLSGGASARIVVLATGYAAHDAAQADADAVAAALQPGVSQAVKAFVIDDTTAAGEVVAALRHSSGIFLTSPDRSAVAGALAAQPDILAAVKSRWLHGRTLLADDAAAAVLGSTYVADGIADDVEVTAPLDMLADGVTIAKGLGWVTANIEPRLIPDQNWGQAIRLSAAARSRLSVALDVDTALEVRDGRPVVRGLGAAVVLDGRLATFSTGTNTSLAAAWMLIDTFTAGERLAP
jgi:cyanophycinase-like exopeptidase